MRLVGVAVTEQVDPDDGPAGVLEQGDPSRLDPVALEEEAKPWTRTTGGGTPPSVWGRMSRRIEVELTSKVDEGTWTWRAAGAKQPKGTLDAKLLYDAAKVGDVVRAEADIDIDGIVITAVLPPKAKREEAPHIELLPTVDRPAPTPAPSTDRSKAPRRDRPPRADGRDRPRQDGPRDRPRREGGGRERPAAARDGGGGRGRTQSPPRPRPEPLPERPKPKRLSPGHTWRKAVLELLPLSSGRSPSTCCGAASPRCARPSKRRTPRSSPTASRRSTPSRSWPWPRSSFPR